MLRWYFIFVVSVQAGSETVSVSVVNPDRMLSLKIRAYCGFVIFTSAHISSTPLEAPTPYLGLMPDEDEECSASAHSSRSTGLQVKYDSHRCQEKYLITRQNKT